MPYRPQSILIFISKSIKYFLVLRGKIAVIALVIARIYRINHGNISVIETYNNLSKIR